MPRFDKNTLKDLEKYINSSDIHDSTIDACCYSQVNQQLTLVTSHPTFQTKTTFCFHGVELVLGTFEKEIRVLFDTIYYLSIEEDFSSLKEHLQLCKDAEKGLIYLLFEMISQSTLHVVCRSVDVDTSR